MRADETRTAVDALILPEGITVTPLTADTLITFSVREYGVEIGEISVGALTTSALPTGARLGTYRFATPQDAVAAVISYSRRGWWTNEI